MCGCLHSLLAYSALNNILYTENITGHWILSAFLLLSPIRYKLASKILPKYVFLSCKSKMDFDKALGFDILTINNNTK